jgi:hypothetical protein
MNLDIGENKPSTTEENINNPQSKDKWKSDSPSEEELAWVLHRLFSSPLLLLS